MSDYVWSTQDMLFANGIFEARLLPGQVWWADDPLVKARPEFFSATPLQVLSTTGRPAPGATPVVQRAAQAASAAEPAPVVKDETAPVAAAAVAEAPKRSRRG